MKLTENGGIVFYLFIMISCVYLLTFEGNNIDSSDQQQVRFATTQAIVERGDLSVPNGMGVKGSYGRDYSWYGIGQPVLAIPFYVIGRFTGGLEGAKGMVSMINLIAVSLSGVIVFLFIVNVGYSARSAIVVTVFYAFGTVSWPQSKHPFDHPVEMLFILLSVYFANGFLRDGLLRRLMFSSIFLGVAFLTRPPAALALFPIALYLLYGESKDRTYSRKKFRDCIIFFLAFAPFIMIQFWYNYARFGSIFETGIRLMAQRVGIDFFSGTPFFTGISGLLASPGKGFFFYSPISILFFFSVKSFYKRNKGLTLCILGIILSYVIFISKNIYWHGDWSWGPRYIFVITPFLMIPVVEVVERWFWGGKRILRYLLIGLYFASIGVQLIGISIDFNRYFFSLQAEQGITFTVVGGDNAPQIIEPPDNVHFEWDKSPIIYNAATIIKIWNGMNAYVYNPLHSIHGMEEALLYSIKFNVFDFWWLYALYTGTPLYIVLLELVLLGFIIILSWVRISRMVKE